MPLYDLDIQDPWLGRALVLKPDGITMTFTSDYLTSVTEDKIESIRAPIMHMIMKMYWSMAYTFDGTLRFDGEQTFFGWTYNLPVSMAHIAAQIIVNENIIAGHTVSSIVPIMERIEGVNMFMCLGGLISTEDCNIEVSIQAKIDSSVETIHGNKVVYSHNPGFFDGQYTFNGARKFDSYYKEEDF